MADTTREAVESLIQPIEKIVNYQYSERDHLIHNCGLGTIDMGQLSDMCATLRALITERDAAQAEVARLTAALAELRSIAERLPAGVWETWTACSYRRITARGGPDGGVLHAHKHRSDGHPDLSWTEAQCRAACDLVNAIRALPLPPRERDGQEGGQ